MSFANLGGKPVERNGRQTTDDGRQTADDVAPDAEHATRITQHGTAGQALPLFSSPGVRPASVSELMAVAMARALRDGEVVVFGAVSLLPLAAARLAQLTHAPNLTILAGASAAVNPLAVPLLPSSGDYGNLVAEAALSFHELLLLQAGERFDVFFAGGLQIDQAGNANLVETPAVRGPGPAGHPLATRVGRTILYTANHDRRTFVPRVDFVALPGWGRGPVRGAPGLVVTPLAVLDFADGRMRLVSTHGGADADAVQAATGFPLIVPAEGVPMTPAPSSAVLKQLRALDEGGLLVTPDS